MEISGKIVGGGFVRGRDGVEIELRIAVHDSTLGLRTMPTELRGLLVSASLAIPPIGYTEPALLSPHPFKPPQVEDLDTSDVPAEPTEADAPPWILPSERTPAPFQPPVAVNPDTVAEESGVDDGPPPQSGEDWTNA